VNPFLQNKPLIYLITKGEATAENFSEKSAEIYSLIENAVRANIDLIQIREKNLSAKLVFELASTAALITKNSESRLLINDRADIAFAANADGVHLTSVSLPTAVIRQNFPRDFIVGVSTHTLDEAESAERQGADFITFSPIFNTPSKEKYRKPPQGLEKLREVCKTLKSFPVIAMGGIDESNLGEVIRAGAGGFAAIRFLNDLLKKGNTGKQEILEN
jgi:thiamine-phosphate pyrophosphorylase